MFQTDNTHMKILKGFYNMSTLETKEKDLKLFEEAISVEKEEKRTCSWL